MIIRQFPIPLALTYPLDIEYGTNKIAYFDIETTGFAADTTYLYLIGCIFVRESSLHMIQWFSEDIREEKELIRSFFEFIKEYDLLVHYNGSGFDIPYLMKKCEILQLNHSFENIISLDLYKKISPIRKIFKLSNYKQKSIEAFLRVDRVDTFGGGELIEVYQSYLGKKHIENLKKSRAYKPRHDEISEADKLLHVLLQHNEDDLKGLVHISQILYYCDLFEKSFHILQAGVDEGRLTVHLEYNFNLPVRISFGNDCIYIRAYGRAVHMAVDIYEGELKHFYDNYRDYYYLPEEDRAVHKSLAIFVEKDYRMKAKPSNCYTKKQGLFVPQYNPVITPSFKKEHTDKLSFVEVHTDFLLREENLTRYIHHILGHIIASKG